MRVPQSAYSRLILLVKAEKALLLVNRVDDPGRQRVNPSTLRIGLKRFEESVDHVIIFAVAVCSAGPQDIPRLGRALGTCSTRRDLKCCAIDQLIGVWVISLIKNPLIWQSWQYGTQVPKNLWLKSTADSHSA
jgi:hypothetical protein